MADITYLPEQVRQPTASGHWLDRCPRKITGGNVRQTMPEDLLSEALRQVLAVAGLVVHSDQDSGHNFKPLVARHEAVQGRMATARLCGQ